MAEFPSLGGVNSSGEWGPKQAASIPLGLLYQPFSKSERLGMAAEISQSSYNYRTRRYNRHPTKEKDETESFHLVDTSQTKSFRFNPRRNQRRYNNYYNQFESKDQKQQHAQRSRNRERDRLRLEMKYKKKWKRTANRRVDRFQRKNLKASAEIKPSWPILKEVSFPELNKATFEVPKAEDLYLAGSVPYLARSLEGVRAKNPERLALPKNRRPNYPKTAYDDPIMDKHAKEGKANVFATEEVLAYLMSAARSFYPFDIIVRKENGCIYFDKRDGGPIDQSTVDENALRPPMEEDEKHINSPKNLNRELSAVTRFYKSQTLTRKKKPETMGNKSPFSDKIPTGYRYRVWELHGDFKLMARCHHDAICVEKVQEKQKRHFVATKALLEFGKDMFKDGWRKQLESQRGSVLITAMKNNGCMFSRWVISSLLSANKEIKVVFVSRRDPKVSTSHVILGVETLNTQQTAAEMDIKLENGFAIVASLVNLIDKEEEDGEFRIVREATKQSIKVVRVLDDESDEEEDSGDDQDDDDEPLFDAY